MFKRLKKMFGLADQQVPEEKSATEKRPEIGSGSDDASAVTLEVRRTETSITAAKIRQVFDYNASTGMSGHGLHRDKALQAFHNIGSNLHWEPKPQVWKVWKDVQHFKAGEEIALPAYVQLGGGDNACAYIGIVREALEFRLGTKDASHYMCCPITANPDHIRHIETIFDVWYKHFDLPRALLEPSPAEKARMTRSLANTPYRDFSVIGFRYPPRPADPLLPFTEDVARHLSRTIAREWLASDPRFTHFELGMITAEKDDGSHPFGFTFGPRHHISGELTTSHKLIVRETLAGGIMFLIDKRGRTYAKHLEGLIDQIAVS